MRKWILLAAIAGIVATGCKKTNLEKAVEAGLESGIRQDSALLGLYFGMSNQQFRDHCTEMNKQKKFGVGERMWVQYNMTELDAPATLLFFPSFQDDKTYEVNCEVAYDGWSIGAKKYFADSLAVRLLPVLEAWHGVKFVPDQTKDGKNTWINVSGNRLIVVGAKDERTVLIKYKDMTAKAE